MTANPWLLALHILFLFLWIGQIIYVSRLVGFCVGDADLQKRMIPLQKRLWLSPGLPGVLITGLLLLHGVGGAFDAPRDALRYYLNPRTTAGEPSFWYITFHVKLVSFTLLALVDLWLGRQIFRMAKGGEPGRVWPLAALMGVIGALTAHVVVWVSLSELGVGPSARFIGYGCAALAMAAGIFGGIKLGRADRRAKFAAAHGLAMTLILLIVALIMARPLSFGGATLG
jgi:uncharacterized membrane protein